MGTERAVKQAISARIDVENYHWLKAAAAQQERSANWLLDKLVREVRLADTETEGHQNEVMQ